MTFTLYGLTGYSVQYWNGAWVTVTGGSVSGNNKVWRKFTFAPITTTKIRVLTSSSPDAYSRITEVEAWGNGVPPPRTNFAPGGLTSASSQISANYPAVSTINGDRRGLNWNNGGGWNDATVNTHPDWLQIDFNSSKTIDEINVITLQDNPATSAEPTESMTFTLYGLTGYSVQYWNGSAWATVPGGSVSGNNKVWRKFTFSPVTTTKIRVLTSSSPDAHSRLTEVKAWGPTPSTSGSVKWLVPDHLGTPRIILDQTGSLAGVRRHDYLPFGEELFAGTGGRTAAMGYAADGVRQQFTQKERDIETGLDYFGARYYVSTQGRFTGADPYDVNLERQDTSDPEEAAALFRNYISEPQHWNRYAYCLNNPLKYVDPDGLHEYKATLLGNEITVHIDDKIIKKDKDALNRIKANLQKAFDKINSGADKLTIDQKSSIASMTGISVGKSVVGMVDSTFHITQALAENPNVDKLSADIIHDSRHAEQFNRGLYFNQATAVPMEMEASQFTVDVLKDIGGFGSDTVKFYESDAATGHLPNPKWKDKSTPKSRAKVFDTMKKPQEPRN